MSRKSALWASVVVGGMCAPVSSAKAGITASQVIDYQSGTVVDSYWSAPYTNPSAALGTPDLTQNVPDVFVNGTQTAFADDSAITPFNASYNPQNVVAIQNAGGSITLKLSAPVVIGAGAALGIHAAVGLQDQSFPNGQNSNPAAPYTDLRQADLQVSADGTTWKDLGDQTFDHPTNIFTNATDPTGATPGTTVANFFEPFTAPLASFNGENFSQTVATFGGSAGGDWFDLSTLNFSEVNFVRLTTSNGEKMFIDSVDAVSSGAVVTPPPAVPLPAAWAMGAALAPLAGLAIRRRRIQGF